MLRTLTEDDAPDVFKYASNERVAAHMNFEPHQSHSDSLRFIQEYAFAWYREGVPEPLGIALKTDPSRVLGVVGCRWLSRKDSCMELAYALAEEHWNKGFATEAARAMLSHCFQSHAANRIQAYCTVENVGSAHVLEKLGMRHEGVLRESAFRRGRFWDRHVFAILRSES